MTPSEQAQQHYYEARKEIFAPNGGGSMDYAIFQMLCSVERRLVELIETIDPEKEVVK